MKMPNWVYNTLSIEANKETIVKIKNQLNASFTIMIDNSMTTYNNPVIALWNMVKPTDLEAYGKQPDFTNKDELFIGKDWYSWNNANWGTKWDIACPDGESDTETQLVTDEETLLVYKFNTAWSPPMPAIEQLSLQYPEAVFNVEYEEEEGWGGEIEWKQGDFTKLQEYDIPSSHAEMIERRGECYCSPPDFPFSDCVVKA
jgi:hypothetical protein